MLTLHTLFDNPSHTLLQLSSASWLPMITPCRPCHTTFKNAFVDRLICHSPVFTCSLRSVSPFGLDTPRPYRYALRGHAGHKAKLTKNPAEKNGSKQTNKGQHQSRCHKYWDLRLRTRSAFQRKVHKSRKKITHVELRLLKTWARTKEASCSSSRTNGTSRQEQVLRVWWCMTR